MNKLLSDKVLIYSVAYEPTVGQRIWAFLKKKGRALGGEIYRYVASSIIGEGRRPPKYTSFYRYLFYLKALKVIRTVGKVKIPEKGVQASVYELTSEGSRMKIDDPRLINPAAEYYRMKGCVWVDPATGIEIPKVKLGKRRYRRRVLGIPPKSRGRPRKEEVQQS
ncbi:MAG: hypothetical protein DRO12_02510 [Thermoprotei archaeon]|nr:MAG: hypothetical protein DRO12_02510 [Thermoprotei archaeon]